MKNHDIISKDYNKRIIEVLDDSWKIFKSRFINNRHNITKEAPFQHHFANIIESVGSLYCLTRDDTFTIDLETKCENIRNKSKWFDITCEFVDNIKCAIELKYKLKRQGAQDWGRIDAYVDIESLEIAVLKKNLFDVGKFYMITDDTAYINESIRGSSGTIFCLHDGYETKPNIELNTPNNKGRHEVFVTLKNKYKINWEKIDKWYFLELTIQNTKNIKAYTFEEKQRKNENAYKLWSKDDDKKLEIMYCEGLSIKELANTFGRNIGSINSRIVKLELKEKYN